MYDLTVVLSFIGKTIFWGTVEINVAEVSSEQALAIWSSSPQASVFTSPIVWAKLGISVSWWVAFKGNTPFVLWPIVKSSFSSRRVGVPPFSYFFGPIWTNEAWSKSATSRLADSHACYTALLERVLPELDELTFELHPTLYDVRVFDWWNYDLPGQPRFRILPRYSAQLTELQDQDSNQILANMRKWRRVEIRRASVSSDFEIVRNIPLSDIVEIRSETFARQGIDEVEEEIELLPKLQKLLEVGLAYSLGVIERSSGQIVSANLVLDGPQDSNLVLSALRTSYRSHGVGPLATFSAILDAQSRGKSVFDFNGANSPQRGDDKHSYGAKPILYFELAYSKGNLPSEIR